MLCEGPGVATERLAPESVFSATTLRAKAGDGTGETWQRVLHQTGNPHGAARLFLKWCFYLFSSSVLCSLINPPRQAQRFRRPQSPAFLSALLCLSLLPEQHEPALQSPSQQLPHAPHPTQHGRSGSPLGNPVRSKKGCFPPQMLLSSCHTHNIDIRVLGLGVAIVREGI